MDNTTIILFIAVFVASCVVSVCLILLDIRNGNDRTLAALAVKYVLNHFNHRGQ